MNYSLDPADFSDRSKWDKYVFPSPWALQERPDDNATADRVVFVVATFTNGSDALNIYGADLRVYKILPTAGVRPTDIVVLHYIGKYDGYDYTWEVIS